MTLTTPTPWRSRPCLGAARGQSRGPGLARRLSRSQSGPGRAGAPLHWPFCRRWLVQLGTT